MTTLLVALSFGLFIYSASAYTLFALRYRRLTWRRTREGRHLMGQSRVLAALLWATLIIVVTPIPDTVALGVQVALLTWLAFEASRRNRLLTLNQREARDLAEQARARYRDN